MKYFIKCMGTLLLPLVLGIFTVVITFDQRNDARIQRLEDRRMAEEQRYIDQNNSAAQRELDKTIAQQQRQHDINVADLKRQGDDLNAEKQRNLSHGQQLFELDVEIQRHRDQILAAFITDSDLTMQKNNGTLESAVSRAKALTLIRQLDPARNTHLIRFLYESDQLMSGKMPLDLATANLQEINLSSSIRREKLHGLYLAGTSLINASFANRDLTGANFSGAVLNGTDFSNAILHRVDFTRATFSKDSRLINCQMKQANLSQSRLYDVSFDQTVSLEEADFSYATIVGSNFTGRDLKMATFYRSSIMTTKFVAVSKMIDFRQSRGHSIDFTNATLNSSSFDEAILDNATFENVIARGVSFRSSRILRPNFIKCNCEFAKFDMAQLNGADFSFALITSATWNGTQLNGASFHGVRSDWTQIKYARMAGVNFTDAHSSKLAIHFSNTYLDGAFFQRAELSKATFVSSTLTRVDFQTSNLTHARFTYNNLAFANFDDATLHGTTFSMNNLSYANLKNTSAGQILESSLSIYNAILPNSSQGPPNSPLLRNGEAKCNTSLTDYWKTEYGVVHILPVDQNRSVHCSFIPTNSSLLASISQKVNLSRYLSMVRDGVSIVVLQGRLRGAELLVHALDIRDQVLQTKVASGMKENLAVTKLLLHQNTTSVKVSIQFDRKGVNPRWCDYVNMTLDLDTPWYSLVQYSSNVSFCF